MAGPSGVRGAGDGGLLAGQPEEVFALVVVEEQGAGETVEHGCGRLEATLFQPCVVVGGDRGELGDLFTAQADDAAGPRRIGQSDGAG